MIIHIYFEYVENYPIRNLGISFSKLGEYSFDQFTSKLIERANSAGGKDNITVVAVQA